MLLFQRFFKIFGGTPKSKTVFVEISSDEGLKVYDSNLKEIKDGEVIEEIKEDKELALMIKISED